MIPMQRLRLALHRNLKIFCKGTMSKTGEHFPECWASMCAVQWIYCKSRLFILQLKTRMWGSLSYIFDYNVTHCVESVFWSVFSAIQTEYGEMLRICPYSAQSGKTGTKTTPNTDTFQAVTLIFAHFKNWLK